MFRERSVVVDARQPVLRHADAQLREGVADQGVVAGLPDRAVRLAEPP
ncbi:hypothetical protein [Streptomyces noursei]|nr:hypothetical protein [Streptomyces noursei]QRX89926.1 hypothetical protein JNO44_02770 [Streptomyces noursei]